MTTFLLDSSVVNRIGKPGVNARLNAIGPRGLRICLPVLLEVGYSARNANDHFRRLGQMRLSYACVWSSEAAQRRAVEVQYLLAERGQHRSARLSDLLLAATAEDAGLTVLHYDRDFELIADVTGQPVEWVVDAGSAD